MRAASLLVKRDKIMDLHSSGSVSHKFGPLSLIIFLGIRKHNTGGSL